MEAHKDITYLKEPFMVKQLSLKFNAQVVNYSHALPHNASVTQAQFLIYIHQQIGNNNQICKIGVKDIQGKCVTWIMGQANSTTVTMPVHAKKQLLITLDKPQPDNAFISIYLVAYRQKKTVEPLILLNSTKLSASSIHDPDHDVSHSYLDYVARFALAWCARQNNPPYQFIQADFGRQYLVSKVAVQGRGDCDQRVTRFAVYKKRSNHSQFAKIGQFSGCNDRNTIVYAQFEPVIAKSIRVVPLAFNEHISMRWEVYGSQISE